MKKYYITLPDGTQKGPILEQNLIAMLKTKQISPDCLCWTEGMTDWEAIESVIVLPEECLLAERGKSTIQVPDIKGLLEKVDMKGLQAKVRSLKNPLKSSSWNIFNAYVSCWKRFAKFSGRASRSEYWYWILANNIIFLLAFLLFFLFVDSGDIALDAYVAIRYAYGIFMLYSLVTFLPSLAVTMRRLHDVGYGGVFLGICTYICMGTVFGSILVLLYVIRPGKPEANRFGEAPDGPA